MTDFLYYEYQGSSKQSETKCGFREGQGQNNKQKDTLLGVKKVA